MATTPAPNPHNQTTSAQTEVTGRVFLSFCVVFCKFGVCIKCVSVSLGFSLAPSLMWNPQDGASEDAEDRQSDDVVVTTTPNPHNQTTSAHTEAGGGVFFFFFTIFMGYVESCVG